MYSYLLPFSYLWMLAAALLGLRLGITSIGFGARIEDIVGKGDLAAYHAATRAFNWRKTVHAHTFLFAVVSSVTFLALAHSSYGEGMKSLVSAGMMIASVVWTLGALKELRPVMAAADFLLLFSVAAGGFGLLLPLIP